jgi:hypothetical protein
MCAWSGSVRDVSLRFKKTSRDWLHTILKSEPSIPAEEGIMFTTEFAIKVLKEHRFRGIRTGIGSINVGATTSSSSSKIGREEGRDWPKARLAVGPCYRYVAIGAPV